MPSFPEERKQKTLADFRLDNLIGREVNLPVGRFFTVDLESVESYPTVVIDSIPNADEWVKQTLKGKAKMPLIRDYQGNKIEIPKKVERKFYVGSLSVFQPGNNHAKASLAEAVAEATRLAQDTEQDQIVVQIIRVVRLQKRPVSVQKV